MSDYIVKVVNEINKEEWLKFYNASSQATPFMHEDYLNAVGFRSTNFLVSKKGENIIGLCLAINQENSEMTSPVPFAPFQGLIYRNEKEIKLYNFYKENLEATSFLLEYIGGKYRTIRFSNHYTVNDIRAISWYNYHIPEKGMYDIDVLYTGVKDLSIDKEIESTLSKGRKYDYKYSRTRYHLQYRKLADVNDIEDFMFLYRLTFKRQDISLSDEDLFHVKGIICTALKNNYGFLRYAETEAGVRIGAVFILYDKNCAYYLFGTNHPEYRSYGGGTFLLVETMKEVQKKGIRFFDFVGANSPQRGDFKLSFGAELKPYYLVRLKQT